MEKEPQPNIGRQDEGIVKKEGKFKKESLPQEFALETLKPSRHFGGSSVLYFLGDNFVVKEKLSDMARDIYKEGATDKKRLVAVSSKEKQVRQSERVGIIEKLNKTKEFLENNLNIAKKYLSDYILSTQYLIKDNKNNLPTIFCVQEKLPNDCKFLNPDELDLKLDDVSIKNLQGLIEKIELMYKETGLMMDLLSLSNVAFSPAKRKFYLYDLDPLICGIDREEDFSQHYFVSGSIENIDFKSFLDKKTQNGIEANIDNLQLLKEIASGLP